MKKIKMLCLSAGLMAMAPLGGSASGPKGEPVRTLTPEVFLTLSRVGGFDLNAKGNTAVYAVSFPDVKTNKSVTQLFKVMMDGSGRTQITDLPKGAHSPKWIPGSSPERIAYLTSESGSSQIWTMLPDGSDKRRFTDVEGGVNDYKFSADGKQLLFVKDIPYDKSFKQPYADLPQATGRLVTDFMYKHWDQWVENIPHTYVAKVGESMIKEETDILGKDEPYELPMLPFNDLEDVSFSPDGKTIAYACRKKTGLAYSLSTNSDIYLYDISTGKTQNVSEGMMGYDTAPTFSPDGKTLAWVSMEHDGYESDLKRLFVMDLGTGKKTYLSEGFECNVESPCWSADGKRIYFVSCKEAVTDIWQINVKSRKIDRLTEEGVHNYTSFVIRNGKMLAGRQSMQVPTDLYSVNIRTGKPLQITDENKEKLGSLTGVTVQKRWVDTTNGEKMLVWVILPPGFDATKIYPAVLFCQGGPQDAVSQFWSFRWNFRLMAEQGYIVIAPNRHGVPSFGKKWNEQISGDYGGQNMKDYMAAVDAVKQEPYVDEKHIGCVGPSYGGFSTYWLAGNHDKRFAAFIAHAGIFNLEMQYMTTEEMWFANWDMGGAPWEKDNKVAQRTFATSPHKFIDKWDTPILIIHGELDFRILASQGMAAFNAAKMRGIPTEMLIFPDENHWILRPQNALLWHRTFFGWLDRWLKK